MEFFTISGEIPVHVYDSEKGDKTIVLLHGYLETLYVWEEFVSLIDKEYRVITMDLPGHGLTGTATGENSLGYSAETVLKVMERCGVEKAAIAGHSMGGYIALEFAARYPGRIDSLILMHSLPWADTAQKADERRAEIGIIEAGKLSSIVKKAVVKCYAGENVTRFKRKIEETVENAETHEPQGIIASIRGMISRPDNELVIKNLKIPLLMFFGEKDNFITLEKAHDAASLLPGTTTVFLKNSGHNGFIEEPELVSEALVNFIKHTHQKP